MTRPIPREFDLLIFDLDGTLIDTRQDLANAVNHAAQHLGKEPLSLEQVTRLVGDGVRTFFVRAFEGESEEALAKALALFREFYSRHLADHSLPYPRMREVLAHFHAQKKAVLSNKPQEFTLALLQRLEVHGFFEMIIGGGAGFPLKPDPQALHAILASFQTLSHRALMIGDGENDILAGKAAGVKTCAVTYGFRPAEKLLALQPDYVAHAPEDLTALF